MTNAKHRHPRSDKCCAECGLQLEIRNKSGLCRAHAARSAFTHNPEINAKISKSHRARLMADPEIKEAVVERMRAVQALPQSRAARKKAATRDMIWRVGQTHLTPEVRAKAGRSLSETRMAWCPRELRDEYRHLIRIKRIPSAEAREMILAQHEADMDRFRKSIGAPA